VTAAPAPAGPDPYILRGLLWCGMDELPMVAVQIPGGSRTYGCRDPLFLHRFLDAETLERLVWQRFAALNETLAADIPESGRHGVLRRVVVTSSTPEVVIEWRD
jgi:hypothetical protein